MDVVADARAVAGGPVHTSDGEGGSRVACLNEFAQRV